MANEDSESQTSSVGGRASAPTHAPIVVTPTSIASLPSSASSPQSPSGKKRRRRKKLSSDLRDVIPMGASTSKLTELPQSSTTISTNPANPPVPTHDPSHDGGVQSTAIVSPTPNLGNNRLATGFKPAPLPKRARTYSDTSQANSPGDSKDDAIEISSDEEMEDSEGGMVVNVNDMVPGLTTASTSDDDGIVTRSEDNDVLELHEDLSGRADLTHSADFTSSNIRLVDLDPADLEEQLKYTLYHLDRTQVDLNRLVTCLGCMKHGHLSSTCPQVNCKHCNGRHSSNSCPLNQRCSTCRKEGHTSKECTTKTKITAVPCDVCGNVSHVEQQCPERHFTQMGVGGPIKLWVSCCICASRSHLAGDCPDAPIHTSTARWSLESFDPNQITNLCLESSTRNLEDEAEARGMRPVGLAIKGRASQHQTGVSRSTQASDDDQSDFLRPSVNRSNPFGKPQIRLSDYQTRRPDKQSRSSSDRYDRFDAPSIDGGAQSRGRGSWYNTDSFGRRRSRSPRADSYRPAGRRSPSPRRFHDYVQPDRFNRGPPPTDYWRPGPSRPRTQPSAPGNSGVGLPSSKPVQLPSRRGSNPNLPIKPPISSPNKSAVPAGSAVIGPRKNNQSNVGGGKKNKKKRAVGRKADFEISDVGDDFSILGNSTQNDLNVSADGVICLDLPDNLQAWLDKINGKRKRKGKKPFFISDHGDVAQPKQLTLFDAEIGKRVQMKGIGCAQVVAKGHRLLGTPDEARMALQKRKRDEREAIQDQKQADEQRPRYILRSRKVFAGLGESEEPRYPLRSRVALGTAAEDKEGDLTGLRRVAIGASQTTTPDLCTDVVLGASNAVREQTGTRAEREISTWLAMENSFRTAQGKGPVSIQRAPPGALDPVGTPIHSYLTDPATGASRSLSSDRYNEMSQMGRLLQVQEEQGAIKRTRSTRALKDRLHHMRGQALPQSAPVEFAKAIHHGMRNAAAEGRQVLLSNLSLDATAFDIDLFFYGYEIESVSITYDRITELPTGLAHVDMKTSEDATAAIRELSGKALLDKAVTLELRSNPPASSL